MTCSLPRVPGRRARRWLGLAALAVVCPWVSVSAGGETDFPSAHVSPQSAEPAGNGGEVREAVLRVHGYGFLGNRQLRRLLTMITGTEEAPAYFTANQIEDAALILIARMQEDGYLLPEVEARLVLEDGEEVAHRWNHTLATLLPRPTRAVRADFYLEKGILFHYRSLEFEGLTLVEEEDARGYFLPTGFLLETKRMRMYTPDRFDRGLANLREVLIRAGHERARVTAASVERNDETGEVDVVVRVDEGPFSVIRSARVDVVRDGEPTETSELPLEARQPYSRIWAQDTAQQIRADYYRRGHPDAEVELLPVSRSEGEDPVRVDLRFRVIPGPYVKLGDVIFRGQEKTQEKILNRRVRLKRGEALNRTEVDQARFRLARLGIFSSVQVEYEDAGDGLRNVIFKVEEGREVNVNLLFGYGSYEMFRGGVEVDYFNVFGRAHRTRLLLVQSMKSSSGSYTYRVPELFGEEIHGYGQIFGLRREETSFDRIEYGTTLGLQTFLRGLRTDAGIRYTLQELQSRGIFTEGQGVDRARVASLGFDFNRDLRDNPVYPEKGYDHFVKMEFAAEILGGEVTYQRYELGGSHHWPVGGGRFLRASLQHGFITTTGAVETDLPFNRRFFQGGENTVRGYLQGEASPVNAAGDPLGSETYTLLNVEFEQALTPQWGVVLFMDAIGFALNLADYPFNEELVSVGLGIRYKTLIGPIRLEYGRNVNPRPQDPSGALHLSIGFPF